MSLTGAQSGSEKMGFKSAQNGSKSSSTQLKCFQTDSSGFGKLWVTTFWDSKTAQNNSKYIVVKDGKGVFYLSFLMNFGDTNNQIIIIDRH